MFKKLTLFSCMAVFVLSCKVSDNDPNPSSPFSVSTMTASSTSINTGDAINVELTIVNNTDKEVTSFTYDFFISTDNSYNSSDIELTSTRIGVLGKGENKVSSVVNIPLTLSTREYYLIFRYRDPSVTNSEFKTISIPVSITKSASIFTLSGLNLARSTYSVGESIVLTITGKNTITTSQTASVSFFLSSDDKYDSDDSFVSSTSLSFSTNNSTAVRTASLYISESYVGNPKYLVATASLSTSSSSSVAEIAVPIEIIPAISVLGFTLNATNYIAGNSVTANVQVKNLSSTTKFVYTKYYLSDDASYSTDDVLFGTTSYSESVSANSIETIIDYPILSTQQTPGNYYVIAYVASSSFSSSALYITGPQISIAERVLTVSSISLNTTTVNPGMSISSTLNIKSDFSSYIYAYYYLSTDKEFSSDDISLNLNSDYVSFGIGTSLENLSYTVPFGTASNNYYFLVRYQKSTNSSTAPYYTTSSESTLAVKNPSVIFYRNTLNSSYTSMYLFIDGVYTVNLSSYNSSLASPTCGSSFTSTNSFYRYNGTEGQHTYEVRSATTTASGVSLKTGVFSVTNDNCTAVDID